MSNTSPVPFLCVCVCVCMTPVSHAVQEFIDVEVEGFDIAFDGLVVEFAG